MMDKPKVGVSQCLLGDAVRYDAQSKANSIVTNLLAETFELVAVCPEVEAGLSVPRAPVQLSGDIEHPHLTGRDNPELDITDLMRIYCEKKIPQLKHLSGFILKSHSPSCGLHSTPVFINGDCATETSSGVFAQALQSHYPKLILIEETQLESSDMLNEFIRAVSECKN